MDEMIEHGVVMKDGKPAGAELISKPVLRIALVEDDGTGKFPEAAMGIAKEAFPERKFSKLAEASTFPENMEGIVSEAIGYWYEGKIEFVNPSEEANLHIYAYRNLSH